MNLGVREIARRLDLAPTTISAWVTGKAEPTQENLRRLCDLFGISVGAFYSTLPEVAGD